MSGSNRKLMSGELEGPGHKVVRCRGAASYISSSGKLTGRGLYARAGPVRAGRIPEPPRRPETCRVGKSMSDGDMPGHIRPAPELMCKIRP